MQAFTGHADASNAGGAGDSNLERFEGRNTARARIPIRRNLSYFAAILALNAVLVGVLPSVLLTASSWWALLLILIYLSAPLHWALIHEASHRLLHPLPWINRLLGRVLGILFLCPFDILRVGHLCHHALNGRASDRPELYDADRIPRWRARLVYYFRLSFGLYMAELVVTLLIFLPRPLVRRVARTLAYDGNDDSLKIPDIAEQQLTSSERIWSIRFDALVIVLVWGLAIWFYGWISWLFIAAVLARGTLVSIFDNAPHYGMPLGDLRQGHDTRLRPAFRWLVLNANFHGTHHRNPTLPWSELPVRFEKDQGRFTGNYISAPFRQLRGVIPRSHLQS